MVYFRRFEEDGKHSGSCDGWKVSFHPVYSLLSAQEESGGDSSPTFLLRLHHSLSGGTSWAGFFCRWLFSWHLHWPEFGTIPRYYVDREVALPIFEMIVPALCGLLIFNIFLLNIGDLRNMNTFTVDENSKL